MFLFSVFNIHFFFIMGNATAQHILAFVSYTISTSAVLFFIGTLLKSRCSSAHSAPSAESTEAPTASASTEPPSDPKPGDNLIFWSSFTAIAMFCVRSLIVWSCFLVILITGNDIQETDANLPLDLSFTAYALALWTMSLTFVFRIDYGFKDTFLAYHPMAIRVLYGLALILLLLAVVISVFVAMDRLDVVGAGMGPGVLACHFVFSVIMIFLLFRKVFVAMTLKFDQAVNGQV